MTELDTLERGEASRAGTAETSVDGPSLENVVEQVREAVVETPYEVPDVDAGEPKLKELTSQYTRHTRIEELAEFISEKYGEMGLCHDGYDGLRYTNFLHYAERTDGCNVAYISKVQKGED